MVLTVDDSGRGMTEQEMQQALYPEAPGPGQRQGMGLRVVRELVAASGGQLVIETDNHTGPAPEEKPYVAIRIRDTGEGMDEQTRIHAFEPFYTTKDLNGTGLGLWISAGIVTRHQGRLTFRSNQHPIHHGSVFSLFLPSVEEVSREPQ